MIDKMTFSILGAGDMGRWFAKLAKEIGWNVKIADKNLDRAKEVANELDLDFSENNREAVKGAEVVLISVPIRQTSKVIEETADFLKENSLMMDIASVKEDPVETMKRLDTSSELVSIHPLFGPGAEDLEGKKFVSIPVNSGEKYEKLKSSFTELGAQIFEMSAEKHDRLMSVTQSLTHFTLLTFLSTLDKMKYSEEAIKLSTPMLQRLLDISKAFLCENPEVCGDIQSENRYANMARNTSRESSRALDVALKAENISVIEDIFEKARQKFGEKEIKSAYEEIYKEDD